MSSNIKSKDREQRFSLAVEVVHAVKSHIFRDILSIMEKIISQVARTYVWTIKENTTNYNIFIVKPGCLTSLLTSSSLTRVNKFENYESIKRIKNQILTEVFKGYEKLFYISLMKGALGLLCPYQI